MELKIMGPLSQPCLTPPGAEHLSRQITVGHPASIVQVLDQRCNLGVHSPFLQQQQLIGDQPCRILLSDSFLAQVVDRVRCHRSRPSHHELSKHAVEKLKPGRRSRFPLHRCLRFEAWWSWSACVPQSLCHACSQLPSEQLVAALQKPVWSVWETDAALV